MFEVAERVPENPAEASKVEAIEVEASEVEDQKKKLYQGGERVERGHQLARVRQNLKLRRNPEAVDGTTEMFQCGQVEADFKIPVVK